MPDEDKPLNAFRADVMRGQCLKCFWTMEAARLDRIKLAGPAETWREVGTHLPMQRCKARTGNSDTAGSWPSF